ncbi:PigN-domain-containing protein [Polychaeton citri CBS 116435]|uniref:GPI ethanolamine phosphate transferase 1 n=1 Tax=Polychaeton citri CBS 116435 TaxID=1314669 RepID=A0A9P4Q309_9PEZI|nr:PigN-domain-containing protein [Polychaeton citri CBS 116435]
MARSGRLGFLSIAVVFHLVYIYSIFDIYFVSPIVSGMTAFRVDAPAPAKRLVLYVGDGLRADKAFQFHPDPDDPLESEPRPLAPFLRSRVLEHGTFGVSHTRVPTESRPGHVALIAGLYEDVSAVMTGWKMNPVNFDSVFNRSRHTWSWGSPDILPMFSTGATPGRVEDQTYGAEFEDFSKDATDLDIWVFDRVKKLFKDAAADPELDARLRQDKLVFFLHLLGLDTTGHAYRPYSKEYLHNIKIVDQGVKEITEIINNFYADDDTAFVFTADHGMSDWGSHGDGHPDNTRTPLITWGSGVAPPVTVTSGMASGHEDGFSSDWHLDHVKRHDVAQADVAALMAHLAGLEFPVNSVGELPLSYLHASESEKAAALYANAKQVLEMYHIKEKQKMSKELHYVAYPGFNDLPAEKQLRDIRSAISSGATEKAIEMSDKLLETSLQGLRYLQTYDWLFLRTLVTVGYLGWIAFAFTSAIDMHVLDGTEPTSRSTTSVGIFGAVLVGLYSLLYMQSSPLTYYAYAFFAVMFWEEVFARRGALSKGGSKIFGSFSKQDQVKGLLSTVAYVGALEIMVQSYFHREVYTISYLLAATWPLFYGLHFVRQNLALCATWAASAGAMSVFTLLPANKIENANLIQFGGLLILVIGVIYLVFEEQLLNASSPSASRPDFTKNWLSRSIFGVQVGLVALAMAVTRSSVASLQAKQGLPLGTQAVGWITLIVSLTVPFLHALAPRDHYLHRLMVIFLAFGPLFVILTISYEGLFYFSLSSTLLSWVRLENKIFQTFVSPIQTPKDDTDRLTSPLNPAVDAAVHRDKALAKGDYRSLTLSDTRICLFFFYFLQSAFFSTGNIASVSSFSLDAVYRLIPVFDPFSQSALLIFKILAPFALVSANLGILTKRLKLRGGSLFAVVMGIGDYLTLRFFWEVRDEGSWLDIGESISQFCIASGLCVFVAALEAFSEIFVKGVEFKEGATSPSTTGQSNGVLKDSKVANGGAKQPGGKKRAG